MKRNKEEIAKMILRGIVLSGAVIICSYNPYFVSRSLPRLIKYAYWRAMNKKRRRKFTNTFYYLKKQGLIDIENRGGQIYISLTKEGKTRAGKYQIDDLEIKKPKKWDGRWRILIFDIEDKHRIKREALRGKLRDLGLYKLQESVWVYPYKFYEEIDLLRNFFGLKKSEVKIILASVIEDDWEVRKFFKLK